MIAVVSEYFLNGNKTPNFLLASLDELFCAPNFCDTSMAWHVYLLSHFFVDGRTRSEIGSSLENTYYFAKAIVVILMCQNNT